MSDIEVPQQVARMQVISAVNIIVQLKRFSDGSRRVSEISESLRLRGRELFTQTI